MGHDLLYGESLNSSRVTGCWLYKACISVLITLAGVVNDLAANVFAMRELVPESHLFRLFGMLRGQRWLAALLCVLWLSLFVLIHGNVDPSTDSQPERGTNVPTMSKRGKGHNWD